MGSHVAHAEGDTVTTLPQVQAILKEYSGVHADAFPPAARFADLAIDSLGMIEIMFNVEEKFAITIKADQAQLQAKLQTVGDLVDYIDALVSEQHERAAGQESGPPLA